MVKAKKLCIVVIFALVMGMLLSVESGRAANASFYNRKVIEIIVATKVGGAFDTDARLIAPYLQKELPGSTVIVRNVPGGGHIVGTNRVWDSRPNGLTIGFANIPGLIASEIREEKGIRFNLSKFTWLGRLTVLHRMMLARKKAGFDTIAALMKNDREFKVGTAGVGDGPYNTALLTASVLGLKKVRMIPNFGGGEVTYGIMRNEIEGVIGTAELFGPLIEQGLAVPILSFDLKRWKEWPNVPTLSELVKTDTGKAVATYLSSEGALTRAVFTSPNLPEDITRTLRTALMKAAQNEAYKKIFVKTWKRDPDPLSGEETAKKVLAVQNMPPDVARLIRQVAEGQ